MDFPVEATVHLDMFQDKREVRGILRSHGFEMMDRSINMVHVQGSFLKLKAVKTQLEQLLNTQKQTNVYSSSKPSVSSGAIPKNYYSSSVSDGNRSRLASRDKPPHASPSSPNTSASQVSNTSHNHLTSPQYRASFSPRADLHTIVVEGDVFRYADRLRRKDIDNILQSHKVRMDPVEVGESFSITLQGESAKIAAVKLQSFLNDLTKSLRTQEVPRQDMDHEGEAFLQKILKNKNIYNNVLVCEMNDRLHLIGPSGESYELKQRLLGRSVDQSGRRGRTFDRNSRKRSISLPAVSRKNTERDSGAVTTTSVLEAAGYSSSQPVGAAGYSPSKYQDDKQECAKSERGASRGRTQSESRGKKQAEKANGHLQETKNKHQPQKKMLKQFETGNIARTFKGLFKKKK